MFKYLVILLSLICFSAKSQKFSLQPFAGVGSYLNESHSQGRALLGGLVFYSITDRWQMSTGGFFGGNLFPSDPEIENGGRIVLNPKTNKFTFLGLGSRFNLKKHNAESYPYFQTLIGWSTSTISSADLADTDPLEKDHIAVMVDVGYSVLEFDLGLMVSYLGKIDSFQGTSLDSRPVTMSGLTNTIITLKVGYTIKLPPHNTP